MNWDEFSKDNIFRIKQAQFTHLMSASALSILIKEIGVTKAFSPALSIHNWLDGKTLHYRILNSCTEIIDSNRLSFRSTCFGCRETKNNNLVNFCIKESNDTSIKDRIIYTCYNGITFHLCKEGAMLGYDPNLLLESADILALKNIWDRFLSNTDIVIPLSTSIPTSQQIYETNKTRTTCTVCSQPLEQRPVLSSMIGYCRKCCG